MRIYNVYNPVPHTGSPTHDSAVWVQQRTALLKDNIDDNPNDRLLSTLSAMITDDISNSRQVIVIGDMNCDIFDKKINDIFQKCGLVNLVQDFVDPTTKARSWFRGRRIIDGAWGTPYVKNNVTALGYVPFTFVIPIDQRGLYIDVNAFNVLDEHEAKLTPLPYRRLKTSIPKRVDKYAEAVGDSWFLYNMGAKIDQIEDLFTLNGATKENIERLNKLDDEISTILRPSEIKCCNVGRHASSQYSTTLSKAIKNERLIKGKIRRESMRITFKRSTPIIQSLLRDLKKTHVVKSVMQKRIIKPYVNNIWMSVQNNTYATILDVTKIMLLHN